MSAVFVIDKKKVKLSFATAVNTYDGLATLQRTVGLDLLSKIALNELSRDVAGHIIVDIGCGTGFLTQALMRQSTASQMIAVDIALSMVQKTRTKLKQVKAVQYICTDAEQLPFLSNSVDTIVSNLALQWCQNLTGVFNDFKQILRQEGRIYFSTFGPATLQELKQSWAKVDDYSHVNDFYSADELFMFLQQAGFKNILIENNQYRSNYQTAIELMRELKGIGAHNVLSGRNRGITSKNRMQKMIEAYEKYRLNGYIPATYEIIIISAEV